ncbi:MAG: hypothetical protein Q9N02_01800 [Ghiorsea sp.]|nr:hypothetical protein [Ghiorsea sp.]
MFFKIGKLKSTILYSVGISVAVVLYNKASFVGNDQYAKGYNDVTEASYGLGY